MKIISMLYSFFVNRVGSNSVLVSTGKPLIKISVETRCVKLLRYSDFATKSIPDALYFLGHEYFPTNNNIPDVSEIESRDFRLISKEGSELLQPAAIIKAIVIKSFIASESKSELVTYYQDAESSALASKLYLCNLHEQSFVSVDSSILIPELIREHVVGFDRDNRRLQCFDQRLNLIWRSDEFPRQDFVSSGSVNNLRPVATAENIIFSPGTLSSKEFCKFISYDGDTGDVNWTTNVPGLLHDYVVLNDKIIVSTSFKLVVLCANTGTLLTTTSINTAPRSDEFMRERIDDYHYYNLLHLTQTKLLVFVRHEYRIYMFDRDTLVFDETVDLPAPWYPVRVKGEDGMRVILEVTHLDGPEFHRNNLLELDLNDPQDPIELEVGPDHTVEVTPLAESEQSGQAIVEFTADSLDDAIRFGEIYSQNAGYDYGQVVPFRSEANPLFNGHVHLVIRSRNINANDIEPMLAIMESRFAYWAEEAGVTSGDGKRNDLTLSTEFIVLS